MNLPKVNKHLKPTVETWFMKSKDMDYYDKFIALWISFNAYYSWYTISSDQNTFIAYQSTLLKKDKTVNYKNDGDRNMREFVVKQFQSNFNSNFSNYDSNSSITTFFNYLQSRDHVNEWMVPQWWVLQVRKYLLRERINNQEDTKNYCVTYTNKSDLWQFINIIYAVRCNLMHWWKSVDDWFSHELIMHANNAFESFLSIIYN